MADDFSTYLDAVLRGDAETAVAVVQGAVSRGSSLVLLMQDVVARAQLEVGRRWESGELSVADEHVATGIAEQTLLVLSSAAEKVASGPLVVLACAEGEWHTTPARIAAAVAQVRGVRVRMLGGSTPPDHLHDYLLSVRPAALALSTTVTANLVGAARSIEAAHRADVPVVAGGAAWGRDGSRAAVLGADVHLDDPAHLPTALSALQGWVGPGRSVLPSPETDRLAEAPLALAEEAWRRQCLEQPRLAASPATTVAQAIRSHRDAMRHAAAALLTRDDSILAELLDRSLRASARRGASRWDVASGWRHLAAALAPASPAASAVVDRCVRALGPRASSSGVVSTVGRALQP